ncbi:tetratricopeptide repeat protein [Kitasatospora sp. HPMI-4]|uniref:tetratricopeptide repeat protein n=1 Tax=Kitasatospora sp. HPMI-4 TaxID=3448443 RepID=UPI003F1CAE07
MRNALDRRDLGEVFALARKWGGISFTKIGEAIDMKAERVGKLARGEGSITTLEKIIQVADGLRIPGHLLGLAARPWEHGTVVGVIAQPPAAVALPAAASFGLWEVAEMVRRIEQSDINPASMESIEAAIYQLCRAYPYAPAAELHQKTREGIDFVTRQLDRRISLKQHRDLLVHAGWLFLLGGCLEYDMGQVEAANLSKAAALRIGTETGHGEMTAWAWELEAWFALTQGRYADVIKAVEAGHTADSSHSIGVQLYGQAAKAFGRMGDGRAVRDALEAGRARLDRLPRPEHPDHHFVIDPDKWDFYAMDAYRLLGDDDRAAVHAREVIRVGTAPDGSERSPMRMAEARLTLGVAAARRGELEEAVAVATRALATERKSLPSLLMIAGELDQELRTKYPKELLTGQFHDQVITIGTESKPALPF